MRKQFLPEIRIPDAQLVMESLGVPATDKKGRPIWKMPTPIRYVKHKTRTRDKETGGVIHGEIDVPIYSGASAQDARYVKAQYRRNQRKMDAAEAEALAKIESLEAKLVAEAKKENEDA